MYGVGASAQRTVRLNRSPHSSSPNAAIPLASACNARACHAGPPACEVIPARFRRPYQSRMKLPNRPSSSCMYARNRNSPAAAMRADRRRCRLQMAQYRTTAGAASSTHATPSVPCSRAARGSTATLFRVLAGSAYTAIARAEVPARSMGRVSRRRCLVVTCT